ncbi:transcriptional regulator, partial [Methermicoccus shengliensis]|uniref:Transcriptional regulator n=1 Tax=Methermicoccus shengliensis TaxID=660064 RepID=A0A832RZT1_9EURY
MNDGCRPACERVVFYVLPAIRAQLARVLVKEYGVPQQKVAELMGLTSAAVSQYINSKRGAELALSNSVMEHIHECAQQMLSREAEKDYICKICHLIQSEGIILKEDE